MKGIQIGNIRIALDYSGNFTRGVVTNSDTGEVFEDVVQDIEFDEVIEKKGAKQKKELLIEQQTEQLSN